MSLALDHFFICTDVGAPQAEELLRFGLTEGAPNRHPGQGTANRRFFFANAFLELVWVDDPAEAQSAPVRRTGLWERWSKRAEGASPFGVGLRPAAKVAAELPFETWDYRPPYLPENLAIQMAANSADARLPLVFFIAFGRRADEAEPPRRQPLAHACGLRLVTRLVVAGPHLAEVPPAQRSSSPVDFRPASENLLEVGFDGQTRGQSHDFRPALPLVFHW
jgi:hypothetical protein